MDIRQMTYFYSIVKNKTFTKAARELHISQPSLSAQIKELEQELGCVLLERNTKKVTLTEAGQLFLKLIEPILMQQKKLFREMEDYKTIGLKKIDIGIFPSQVFIVPKIISQFKKRYPNVAININEMGAKDIEDALSKYDIHLGFSSPINKSDLFLYFPVYNEELYLITPIYHSLSKRSQVTIQDLSEENFITYKQGYSLRKIFLEACFEAGFKPKIMYECGRLETIRQLVVSGMGIAVVPENYIRFSYTEGLNIIKLQKSNVKRPLHVVINKNRYYPPPIYDLKNLFIDFFTKIKEKKSVN